ncbi:Hypothetical predicted protein [Pelobates cultripes]|uniref:Uncharacterized protein n=1 Tax=Pelobates cultripes TaxID=61616 RepID=A0AAD1S188_PELCU|nr:Hypothetical predicted protein [Pelobates cultripes]
MGCSSSTQTHGQGANKPSAKSVETNGPKKSASSDISDQTVDDVETIPDQTKLVPDHEASTNGIPPEEEQVEAIEAVELEASEPADETSTAPENDKTLEQTDQSTEVQENHDNVLVEGEIEEAVEAKMHEETVDEGGETKDEETGHSVDAAEPEISTLTGE